MQSSAKETKKMPITVTFKKACEESGLSLRSLQYAATKGQLKTVAIGRRRLIPLVALEDFLLRGGRKASKGHGIGVKTKASAEEASYQ
jgi:hypothetical protein